MESAGRSKIVVVSGIVISVVFVMITLYLLLFAPFAANNKYVMPVRKDFYEKVLYKVFTPEDLPYQAYVSEVGMDESGEEIYTYNLMGRLVRIDLEKTLLVIKDVRGKEWVLDYSTQVYPMIGQASRQSVMVVETKIARDNTEQNEIKYHVSDIDHPGDAVPYLREGDMMMAIWRDKSSLPELMAQSMGETDGVIHLLVIPSGEQWLIPIRKIVGEEQ